MISKIDVATIEALSRAGVSFVGTVATPWGGESLELDPSELEAFLADPGAVYASRHGGSREEYDQWIETHGEARCGATTRTGERCRNHVSGGIQRRFVEWLQEDGGFCKIHGGAGKRHR